MKVNVPRLFDIHKMIMIVKPEANENTLTRILTDVGRGYVRPSRYTMPGMVSCGRYVIFEEWKNYDIWVQDRYNIMFNFDYQEALRLVKWLGNIDKLPTFATDEKYKFGKYLGERFYDLTVNTKAEYKTANRIVNFSSLRMMLFQWDADLDLREPVVMWNGATILFGMLIAALCYKEAGEEECYMATFDEGMDMAQ